MKPWIFYQILFLISKFLGLNQSRNLIMNFDTQSVEAFSKLVKQHPQNAQLDWFVMGILYGHPNNTKSIEDIFNNVNNITSLSRGGALPVKDTNDFLIRIVNNLVNSEVTFQSNAKSIALE